MKDIITKLYGTNRNLKAAQGWYKHITHPSFPSCSETENFRNRPLGYRQIKALWMIPRWEQRLGPWPAFASRWAVVPRDGLWFMNHHWAEEHDSVLLTPTQVRPRQGLTAPLNILFPGGGRRGSPTSSIPQRAEVLEKGPQPALLWQSGRMTLFPIFWAKRGTWGLIENFEGIWAKISLSQVASNLADGKELRGVVQNVRHYRRKGVATGSYMWWKNVDYCTFGVGGVSRQISSLMLIRCFLHNWFKVPFLG